MTGGAPPDPVEATEDEAASGAVPVLEAGADVDAASLLLPLAEDAPPTPVAVLEVDGVAPAPVSVALG